MTFKHLLVVVIVYFIISFVIGLIRTKNINFRDFVVTKNQNSFIISLFSILGIIVGGGMFLAVGQIGFEAGFAGYIVGLGYLVGMLFFGLFIGKIRFWFKDDAYLSIIDFIESRFSTESTGVQYNKIISSLVSISTFIIFFFLLSAQFIAIATFISHYFEIEKNHAILIVTGILSIANVLIYSTVGGYPKDVMTDVFQFILVLTGTIFIAFSLFQKEVFSSFNTLPEVYLNGMGYGPLFAIGAILFIGPSFLVRMDFWQRVVSAKSNKTLRNVIFTAAPLVLLFYVIFTTCGMYTKVAYSTTSANATLVFLDNNFSNVVGSIIFIAFFSAVLSSADTFLNVSSISISRMIRSNLWKKQLSKSEDNGKQILLFLRLSTLSVGLISVLFAYLVPDIVNLFTGSFAILLVLLPTIIEALYAKNPNPLASMLSILIGLFSSIVFFWIDPKTAFVPGLLLSTITFFLLKIFRKTSSQVR